MTDAASIIQRKLDELQVQGYTAIPQAPDPDLVAEGLRNIENLRTRGEGISVTDGAGRLAGTKEDI